MERTIISRLIKLYIVLQYFLVDQILCDSFIKIDPNTSVIVDNNVTIAVSLMVKDSSHMLVVWLYLQSSVGSEKLIAKGHLPINERNTILTLDADFQISKQYAYFDSRNSEIPTDYFAQNIRVHACIYDKTARLCIDELSDEIVLALNSPWRRKELQAYCSAWDLQLKTLYSHQHIPQCENLADTITLARMQLAVAGKRDQGFVKTLPVLNWPKHVPARVKNYLLSHPRFSIEFRVYIVEECRYDFCEILTHRLSLKFLSPVILLNKQGLLHVQFHDKNDVGEAFVTTSPLPLKKWIHIVLTMNGYETQLSISTEGNVYQNYVHRFREIAFDSEIGVWNIGGYYGISGFRGLICCVRLHRRKSLKPEELPSDKRDEIAMHQFGVPEIIEKCGLVRRMYRSIMIGHSNCTTVCYPNKFKEHFLKNSKANKRCKRRQLLSNDQQESIKVLRKYVRSMDTRKLCKRNVVAKELALRGLNEITHSTSLAARLFELSGCLGYLEAFLATSLVQYFKSNVSSVYESNVTSWQLYAAMYDDALSQLALSYKHQIGCGGVERDAKVAAGYAKAAALSVKKIIEDEEQLIHTHSELIRLDEAHLFAGKRGMSSDVMKWLRHQADWGSISAQSQMAEILFHGQNGVHAQRNEAVDLFRAGALQGDPSSMYNLGVLHLRGIEVEKNESIAIDLFRKAAKKNFTIAFNSLGYHELVNRKNITGALHYWDLAALLGDKDAMTNLGIQYENGVPGILEADKQKAFNFFMKSAEKGQKDGCIRYADYLISGEAGEQNEYAAIRYYRFVAEQLPTIGLYLRSAVDSYLEGNLNTSLVMYMLVSETGLALASFNTALLCDEMLYYKMKVGSLGSNCSLHFYNLSSILGWPASIIRMGDEYWYGRRVAINTTKAAISYAWVAGAQGSPQGLFNLAFILENNYSVDGVNFENKQSHMQGNLTLAKILYERCQNSKQDHGEGYYPCTIALLNMEIKSFLRTQKISVVLFAFAIIAFMTLVFMSSDEIY